MADQFNDGLANGVMSAVLLLSMATWFYIFSTLRQRPVLAFEPRQPVPWNALACVLALIFAIKPLLFPSSGEVAGDPAASHHSPDIILFLLDVIVTELLIVGGFTFLVVALSQATVRDVGLPNSARETARDIFIGVLACAAAIVPVLLIQAVLQLILHNTSSGHELIKMLTERKPGPAELAMAALTVVVVAPVCEEIVFRLLLQGFLESWELKMVCRNSSPSVESNQDERQQAEESVASHELETTTTENRVPADSTLITERPSRGIAGLPFGVVPIFVSSLLFAFAHFGYGPEPVPLFFLAIVLGYVYQRTHRILPSIMTHALFNAFAMFILWRLQLRGE
jgi:membrane protease YdiL (CAAX protease family)